MYPQKCAKTNGKERGEGKKANFLPVTWEVESGKKWEKLRQTKNNKQGIRRGNRKPTETSGRQRPHRSAKKKENKKKLGNRA